MAASKAILLSLSLLLASGPLRGQESRYMVFFKDKVGTPYSLSQPTQFLSQKSIDRRSRQNISVSDLDLPVNPAYVNAIKSTGAKVKYSSRWFNGILMEATTAQRSLVAALPSVLSIEFVAPGKTAIGGRQQTKFKLEESLATGATQTQNSILGLEEMHADGFTGAGITIAVFDTGFPRVNINSAFSAVRLDGRIRDSYNFSFGQHNAFVGNDHGARVFSIIAGTLGVFTGGAVDADFLLYATEHDETEYRVEEYNWAFAAERADSAGADIISSSLGYTEFDDPAMDYDIDDLDGKTTVISKAANFAFQRGIVVVASAGNFGNDPWQYIGAPADVENVIAVGSIDGKYKQSSFSSIGPTADGRIKPDVMALGTGAASITPFGDVVYGNGTSFSCPLISSLVAGVWQRWPQLTAGEIVNLIRQSGSQYFSADNNFGYGVPTYRAVKNIMDRPSQAVDILVYPNPAIDDKIKIALQTTDGSMVSVTLYTALGQTIHQANYQAIWDLNPYIVDMSHFAPGVYFLKVSHETKIKTMRIVR
jgi:serine protease AprX